MSATFEIVEVKDLDRAWPDIRRLFLELDEYERPFGHRRLRADWEAILRGRLENTTEGLVLVARGAGEAIGFMNALVEREPGLDAEPQVWVSYAYVMEKWRQMGVGQSLLACIESWAGSLDVRKVRLSVLAANTSGLAAWKALGFSADVCEMTKVLP